MNHIEAIMTSEKDPTLRLPCYEGFFHFAIWPAADSVSTFNIFICLSHLLEN